MFSFSRGLDIVFQTGYTNLHSPPAIYEGSFSPAYSPTFVVGGVLDANYPNKSEVESQCGFDLHFLYGQGW
jgi:hypothetical protein